MTTVADSYRQEKSRLSTGEEYLTQQKFGLIPDEMKDQLGLVEDIKKQNPSMLSFMNVPTADDVFLFDRPFQNRKDIRGITGLSYAPISKGGHGRGGKGAVPHPWIYTEAQFEDKPWEIPASDPKWQNVVSTESKISVAPGSKAPTLMHEQIHLDIRDLVMSGDLSEDDYRVISAGSADNPHFTEHALINYLVLQSGIELGGVEESWLKGLVEDYRTKNNLSKDELEERLEGMIDILNDAKRSRVDYRGQQNRLQQESTRRYQESLSPATLEKLNTPKMQVMPTEPGSQDLLSPRVQEMMDDLINSIAGWSDEEIANIYGVSVEYVQQRRQEIQPQEAEVTQETVPQPSLIDRLKGLLPKGRTDSGMVEPPAGPGYLPGKQSVGEAMSTPLDLSEAALEAQVSPEVRSTQFAPSTLVPEPITRSFGQEPIQVSPERPPMSLAPQSDIRTPISSVRDIPESTPTRAYEPFPLSSIQLSGPEYQQWDVGAEEGLEGNLVDVGTYNLEKKTTKAMLEEPWYENRAMLDAEAADAFNEMQEEYKKGHKDKDIPIESAFRSKLHNDALIKIGLSAVKTSDHLKGLALDITDKHANAWMKKYGNDYGWHFSHYKGNTTHFEFIGVQN